MHTDEEGRVLLSLTDLQPIVANNCILDVCFGGLLLGNTHDQGGLHMIRQFNETHFEIVAEFEGWEYILNANATTHYLAELHQLNDELKGPEKPFSEYAIPKEITLIDARPIFANDPATGKLLIGGTGDQFIVNRHSTKKYLQRLEEMNADFPSTIKR